MLKGTSSAARWDSSSGGRCVAAMCDIVYGYSDDS